MLPGAPQDNRIDVNIRPSRIQEQLMATNDAGHGADRNVKGFGGVDRVPCKIIKQWKVRLLLYSTWSILQMIFQLSLFYQSHSWAALPFQSL